jgi:magnesium transporter
MSENTTTHSGFEDLLSSLTAAIDQKDAKLALKFFDATDGDAWLRLFDRLDTHHKKELFELLKPEQAASLIEQLPDFQGGDLIESIEVDQAAAILDNLDSDDRADILNEIATKDAEAIIQRLDLRTAEETRRFMAYPEGTAGSIMYSEFMSFDEEMTVSEILENIQGNREKYLEYGIQYAYVLDLNGYLQGVLPVRNLLFAKREHRAKDIMIREPVTVTAKTSLHDVEGLFEDLGFLGLPVVDEENRLIGLIDREASAEALQEAATEDLLKVQGLMGKDELRSMPLFTRSRRRLSWLSINIVLNLISASVIAMHQGTLEAVIALAVFLPIISDMSGCSGNQAVAVSMRELSLQLIRPGEFMRVFFKESLVGLVNGICLGTLVGVIAWFWKDNGFLGLVVGSALTLNTIVAVCVGGVVPLLLKACKQDPALASGPILTTITDMCGFLLILGLASAFLPYLVS